MKKVTPIILLLVLSFVLVSLPQIEEVKAQSTIYIRADGTVEGTDKIQRDGTIYTFLGNISIDGSGIDGIIVEKDNIVIDGAGYTLQGNWPSFHPDMSIVSRGITLSDRSNIIVKNVRIVNFTYGIECVLSNNNTITNCYIEYCQRSINQPSNVLITNNTLECEIYLDYTQSDNTITQNNFISKDSTAANLIVVYFAPQPTVYMNYWSDYNGTDINGDGIGDTPYVINQENQDDSPLMNQIDIGIIPEFPSWAPMLLILIVLAVAGFTYRKVVGPVLSGMKFTESYPPLLRWQWFDFWGKILSIVGIVMLAIVAILEYKKNQWRKENDRR